MSRAFLALAVIPTLLLAASCNPCQAETKTVWIEDSCTTPGACELPADVPPALSSQIQIAGGQRMVVPVASALAGLSANPRVWGDLFFWAGSRTPSGAAPMLDSGAVEVTFDGKPVPCDVHLEDGFDWNFACTVPAGVKRIGLAYTGPTPVVSCSTSYDCCLTWSDAAYCACDHGVCVAPIVIDNFAISETTPTGPCLPPPEGD